MPAAVHVKDVDASDFLTSVIEESRRRPVLVDFWASWCGPCRFLGPVLERLAGEFNGAFLLAKIDTEANPEIAQEFGIQSIPNVKLFRDGRVVDEFIGALPERDVRDFLRRNLPSPADQKYAEALARLEKGRAAQARSLLEEALALDPVHAGALLELGRLHAFEGNPEQARSLWSRIPTAAPEWEEAQTLARVLDFQVVCSSGKGPESWEKIAAKEPENLDARYAHGCCLVVAGDHRGALEEFLFVVSRDRNHGDQAARKAMLTIFSLVGDRSDLAEEFRKRLAMVLF